MRLKYGIAIAGSHGKTTTTSMVATILSHAGVDPTVVVGGKVAAMGGTNARVGKSDFLVVEADESDGSFLKLSPIFAIVTNIDREHLDHYASIEAIRAAFVEFVNKVPFYGAAVLCLDDENIQTILPDVKRRTITYGLNSQADYQPGIQESGDFHSRFTLRSRTTRSRRVRPQHSGRAQRPERHRGHRRRARNARRAGCDPRRACANSPVSAGASKFAEWRTE